MCSAEGAALYTAIAGRLAIVVVRLADVHGNARLVGGDRVELSATGPGCGAALCSPCVRSQTWPQPCPIARVSFDCRCAVRRSRRPCAECWRLATCSFIQSSAADRGNGSYEVSYTARVAGSYVVRLLVNGLPLGGSPFALHVEAAAVHAQKSYTRGLGMLVDCVVGETQVGLRETLSEILTFCLNGITRTLRRHLP
jgi:hypothetical protein